VVFAIEERLATVLEIAERQLRSDEEPLIWVTTTLGTLRQGPEASLSGAGAVRQVTERHLGVDMPGSRQTASPPERTPLGVPVAP
jgi:hypothetical protein